MTLQTITVDYSTTRSASYQSVRVGASVEIALAEGEKMEQAFKGAMKHLAPLVDNEADAAIKDIIRMTSNDH
jgi:gamma-glutamylcysteine synthetase